VAHVPRKPAIRQGRGARIRIILELQTQDQSESWGQSDRVLREHVAQVERAAVRHEEQSGAVGDVVAVQALADTPDDRIPAEEIETVLQLDVVGVEHEGAASYGETLDMIEIGEQLEL
jgi:hypothetical protein